MAGITSYRIYYRTLEPVHVGAGGYRLGRVDKTICREPGTNLPKIPGTSLSGAARAYAAQRYGRPERGGAAEHRPGACPIFYTFGYASGLEGGNAGTISVGDAQVLLFPVGTMKGRMWVTSPGILKHAGLEPGIELTEEQIGVPFNPATVPGLNLGWLWSPRDHCQHWLASPADALFPETAGKSVLVPDSLMAPIVNSNLEVRTSVAINPKTGTAAGGKLFSYEAIPRETVLFQDVVEDDYHLLKDQPWTDAGVKISLDERGLEWSRPFHVLRGGLDLMRLLGVGGMGTRGFGRMEIAREPDEEVVLV